MAPYTPNLVSHTAVQDLTQAAQAWDAAHPRPAGTPPGFWRNPYREMLDTVQSDAERFAGGDVDRLGNLWDFFFSFWLFQRG